jgi:hypothetical protein
MFATIDPKSRSIAELRAQSCAWPRSAPSAVHDPSVVMQGVRSYEAATCMAPNCTRLLDSNARHLYPRFQIAIRMNAEILAALRNCSFMYKIFAFLSSMSAFSSGDGRPWIDWQKREALPAYWRTGISHTNWPPTGPQSTSPTNTTHSSSYLVGHKQDIAYTLTRSFVASYVSTTPFQPCIAARFHVIAEITYQSTRYLVLVAGGMRLM